MTINKFQGKTQEEAIAKAKEEFGERAVIMNIREVKPKGLFRAFKNSTFEVTAAMEEKEHFSNAMQAAQMTQSMAKEGKLHDMINLAADEPITIPKLQEQEGNAQAARQEPARMPQSQNLLRIVITSGLQKFQRREFFRIPYTTPLKYYEISEQTAQMQTTEELFTEIQKPEYIDQVREGTIQNISGGGIRFVSGQWIKQNQNILLVIRLTNEYSDETFYLPGQVIATEKHPAIEEMYIHRVKFLFRDLRDREKIVRFVFEEERRIRRKEVG